MPSIIQQYSLNYFDMRQENIIMKCRERVGNKVPVALLSEIYQK